ncbi:NAD-dependent epimerase/dehydratase family protein [Candidatus Gottesmanbacteria bacterium]|nr:NAD-dependent epimerase/dehydratase family protein [Candidatus Gottesmanbacteria bacterium]
MMKKILVTGANGYIGRYLVKKLLQQNYEVVAYVRDLGKMPAWLLGSPKLEVLEGNLADKLSLEKTVEGVDIIFHLAAALRMFEKDKELHKTNILGLQNLLQACQKANRPIKFIFASSIDAEKRAFTDYGKSKLKGEKIVKEFTQKNPQIEHIIVRIGNVYGGVEGGMVEGIRQQVLKNDWRASILYYCLSDKPLYLIAIEKLVDHLVKQASDSEVKNRVLTLVEERTTVKELVSHLKKEKLIANYPKKLPLDKVVLKIWQFLGRIFKRADLLIYLSFGK